MSFKFVLNRRAVRDELLRGAGTGAVTKLLTERALARAGPGHEMELYRGRNRWRGTVRTTTIEARIAEAAHQNLSRAVANGGE